LVLYGLIYELALPTISINSVDKSTRTSVPTSATRTTARKPNVMTNQKAMKLALEALQWFTAAEPWDEPDVSKAIKALEEALAKQEGQSNFCPQCEALARELKAAKQEQGEPLFKSIIEKHEGLAKELAAIDKEQGEFVGYFNANSEGKWEQSDSNDGVPFFAARPQQRTWVGLTEPEVDECYESIMFHPDIEPSRMGVYLEIEAKLKEKNNA
jgi:hypothetical protein